MFDDPHPQISEHFQRIYPGEMARGVNLIGPQRDDMNLELAGIPAREFASNGEMWTMALALKMALFEIVRDRLGLRPIVILDDVFAQLDDSRRTQILDFARKQDQVLITVAAEGDVPDYESAHRIDVATLAEPASVILPTLGNLSRFAGKRVWVSMTENPRWTARPQNGKCHEPADRPPTQPGRDQTAGRNIRAALPSRGDLEGLQTPP